MGRGQLKPEAQGSLLPTLAIARADSMPLFVGQDRPRYCGRDLATINLNRSPNVQQLYGGAASTGWEHSGGI